MTMAMPTSMAAMRSHMTDDPPEGHGRSVASGMSMDDMEAQHDAAHEAGAAHTHSRSRMAPPRQGLVRAQSSGIELGSDEPTDGSIGTLTGHFSVFDVWYEVDSVYEGHFLERIAPGAFADTIANDRGAMRVTFNHGTDPSLGNKVLGPITALEEDRTGARYEVALLDTTYNRDLLPGLKAGVYGSSFRFNVLDEEFDHKPGRSRHNPDGIPERTITRAHVGEFGPVTFPASPAATAGVRSLTDQYRPASIPTPEARTEPEPAPEPPQAVSAQPKETPVEYVTRDEKAARVRELKAELTRQATEYPGVMPEEAQNRWDADNKELDTLERDIAAWDSRVARTASFGQSEQNRIDVEQQPTWTAPAVVRGRSEADIYDIAAIERQGSPERRDQAYRDNAMRAVETARYAHPDADVPKTQGFLADLLDHKDTRDKDLARRILLTGAPVYRRAFAKYLSGSPMSPEEQRYAALTSQVDATGGFSIPFFFDPTMVHVGAHTAINPYRRACRVIPIVGTDTYHGVTAAAVLATRAAEEAAVAEGGGAIGQISAIVGKVHALVTASVEIFSDRPDLATEVASLIAEAKDTEEENIFTVGVGDALGQGFNPIGMLCARGTTGAYTAAETATNNTFAIADLYSTEAALPVRHRMNAAWFMGRATIRAAQAMETTGGQLFGGQNYASVGYPQNDPFGNTGLRLMNYPVWEVPSAGTGTADNAIIGALVAPQSFYVIERLGMTVEVIPHAVNTNGLPTGQRRVYAWWRNTAKPSNVDAGRTIAINPA